MTDPSLLMEESFRWYGPADPVPLAHVRQTGATAVFTALHQVPYGEAWPAEAIAERKATVELSWLRWTAVESVPIHEAIKTGRGDLPTLFDNYRVTLERLADAGVTTVVYNFMPVLDGIRTDVRYRLPDGSECLRYDPARFAAFEVHAWQRAGAEADYPADVLGRGRAWWASLADADREAFVQAIIDVFPGT